MKAPIFIEILYCFQHEPETKKYSQMEEEFGLFEVTLSGKDKFKTRSFAQKE